MVVVVGNYLTSSEIEELTSSFKESQKYKNLIQEMGSYGIVDDRTFDVSQGLKFDLIQNEDVISAKSLTLQLPNDVSIMYIVRHLNGDKETTNDFFVGAIEEKDEHGGVKETKFTARNEVSVSIFEKQFNEEQLVEAANLDKKSKEEFPFDENYYPGQLLEQVDSQAWYSGCMAGGYHWCGEGCGGSIACSSQLAGVNQLDNCCKSHDCCYTTRGVKHPNCYCDEQLCKCANAAKWYFNTPLVQAAMCFSC
ncbi:hypothetical protein H7992_09500 [Sporosarcina sp. resist]|uniref:hypothetical protein n=1 Tax=Sporosarcina sp. resist TaxID=2762563 RepID=UPI00164D86FB|nr:hypothetical protein [Sporosarcina sp. resist]QNK89853.1 hypothetical protein H7992_09500 [Sporosarcina sp. resist]